MAEILHLRLGDVLELKKPHPCGDRHFKVLRVGSDVRICCLKCGRDMTMERIKLEKAVRRIVCAQPNPNETNGED